MKKQLKILSLIMAMIIMLGTFCVVTFAEGEASTATVTPDTSWYLEKSQNKVATLRDAADLLGFAKLVNEEIELFDGWTIKLGKDIVFNEGKASDWAAGTSTPANVWTPIYGFFGTFDGQGYTISGLYFNDATAKGAGLFSMADGATIKNVSVVNSYFCCLMQIGGIVAVCQNLPCTISNCYTDAIICNPKPSSASDANFVDLGGIVGQDTTGSTIENCWFDGTIITSHFASSNGGFARSAGIVAFCKSENDATIKNCLVTGSITGQLKVGGIVGDAQNSGEKGTTIENCLVLPKEFNVLRKQSGDLLCYGLFGYVSKNISLKNVYGASEWFPTIVNDPDFISNGKYIFDGRDSFDERILVWDLKVTDSSKITVISSENATTLVLDTMKGDAAKTSLTGLDFDGDDAVWVTVADGTPVIKALANIAANKTSGQAEAAVDPSELEVESDEQPGDQPGDDQPGDDQPSDDQPNDQPNDDDDAADTNAPETNAPETNAPETNAPDTGAEEKKGCGGTITGMSVAAIAMIGAACGMIVKKKED